MVQRLDRWIASHSDKSRKEVRVLVRHGQVVVDGVVATDSGMRIAESSTVTVSGKSLQLEKYLYLMMNKPAGVLSATRDNKQETVVDLLPQEFRREDVFPAGRLDKDTEGFLFLTNDGKLAHQVTAPKNRIPKTYYIELESPIDFDSAREEFARGVYLGDGESTSLAELVVLQTQPAPQLELTIYEGLYHQVKRMFGLYGGKVTYLKRLKIGNLSLDDSLGLGEVRRLTEKEQIELGQNAQKEVGEPSV